MTQGALPFAEENLLPDRGQVIRRVDLGDIKRLDGRWKRGHLRHAQRDQGKRPQDDHHEADHPEKFGLDEEQDADSESYDKKTDQLE